MTTEKADLKVLLKQIFVEMYHSRSRKSISLRLGADTTIPPAILSSNLTVENKTEGEDAINAFVEAFEFCCPSKHATLDDLARILSCDAAFLQDSINHSRAHSQLLNQLTSCSKKSIQDGLRRHWFSSGDVYCCAFDSHDNNYLAPFYSTSSSEAIGGEAISSSSSGTSSGFFRNKGKSDFSSLAVGMFLEMKGYSQEGSIIQEGCVLPANDYSVLMQAIERVAMCIQ